MDSVTSGKIIVDGKDISKYNERGLTTYRRNDIGFVFQFYNLIPNLTAKENVELASQICKDALDPEQVLKDVGLEKRMNNFPGQLSGGEQQRVAIARTLAYNPEIILADEPTGNLDSKSSHIIMEELADVHKKGNTIIMVTHNPELMAYATRVITMFDGKIDTDTKMKTAKAKKAAEKAAAEPNTLDKIATVTEKLDEIKEELGV